MDCIEDRFVEVFAAEMANFVGHELAAGKVQVKSCQMYLFNRQLTQNIAGRC